MPPALGATVIAGDRWRDSRRLSNSRVTFELNVAGSDVRADGDDALAVLPGDDRGRRGLAHDGEVAEMDDGAALRADRDRREPGEIAPVVVGIDHLDVLQSGRTGVLRDGVAAERGANRVRRRADVDVERARRVAIEVDLNLW